jgi:Domain of unknown function (DUF4365)
VGDLGVNYVERQALLCEFSVERVKSDYGIDLVVFTYSSRGEAEDGCLYLQSKATENPRWINGGTILSFRVAKSDLERWLNEPLPVILAIYDVAKRRAYWIYVQRYFLQHPDLMKTGNASLTIHVPRAQVLSTSALRSLAAQKNDLVASFASVAKHG